MARASEFTRTVEGEGFYWLTSQGYSSLSSPNDRRFNEVVGHIRKARFVAASKRKLTAHPSFRSFVFALYIHAFSHGNSQRARAVLLYRISQSKRLTTSTLRQRDTFNWIRYLRPSSFNNKKKVGRSNMYNRQSRLIAQSSLELIDHRGKFISRTPLLRMYIDARFYWHFQVEKDPFPLDLQ